MKKISLNKGMFALVDDDEFEKLDQYKWRLSSNGYAGRKITVAGKQSEIYMHRVVNKTPKRLQTDHQDGNILNNQKYNLRNSTNSQNQMNSPKKPRKNGTSKYKGVQKVADRKNLWRVHINIEKNKTRYIGYFKNEIEAAKTYDEYAQTHFGEFACLNFPL